jgi:TetR/AcrR family transcriptional regulator, lmrAB and yxaGH operons repressor
VALDSRDRMIRAAIELFRERGYAATSFGDVIAASGAPRGSIYHHFPGGKTELAVEALRRYSAASLRRLHKAAEAGSAADVVGAFLDAAREELVRAGYHRGCPIAGVALDLTATDTALADVVADALAGWRDLFAEVMVRDGAEPARARRLAALVVATGEGALLLGRAQRSTGPLDDARAELVALVGSAARGGGR